ncbi:multidrug resistance protein, MATE family [Deferribacter desulfuricans SSM1]|uniref:Multidrug-efflux transporter n=1 Tax=Deferribacter desulfuricans (strain DSM 14783 / JCM 11476 / NBRC 101012 / SSM1) TaxID=639282 RepID=D3PCG2_DEFDS|nr:MATE family efflux transporter [Deferribacter desulfuricans]BAI80285.1 multidrug resistance protein, MATE family [Deferribacter desulfuricans SSM1]
MKSLIKKSWQVSWPMILIMFAEFIISITDVYIAGKLGKEYQASVGFVSQIYFVLIVVINAVTMGTVALISRKWSEKNEKNLKISISTVYYFALLIGFITTIFGVLFAKKITLLMPIHKEIRNIAAELAYIYTFGVLFHYILILTNGVLRSINKVKLSLLTMIIICLSNVGLNFYFVFHTNLYFKGIALSTVFSVIIGAILNTIYLSKYIIFIVPKIEIITKVLKVGVPSGILQIGWQLGSTVLFFIINKLKTNPVEVMAAFTNGIRIESAIFLPAFAFNMANAVIVGNLLGEKKKNEAYKNGIVTAIMGAIIVTFMTIIIILNANKIANILSNNQVVIKETVKYLIISMISEPFMAFGVILGGGISGAGDTKSVMKIVLSSLWLIRIPLAFIGVVFLKFDATFIWWCMNLSIFIQCFLIFRHYKSKRWQKDEL